MKICINKVIKCSVRIKSGWGGDIFALEGAKWYLYDRAQSTAYLVAAACLLCQVRFKQDIAASYCTPEASNVEVSTQKIGEANTLFLKIEYVLSICK